MWFLIPVCRRYSRSHFQMKRLICGDINDLVPIYDLIIWALSILSQDHGQSAVVRDFSP